MHADHTGGQRIAAAETACAHDGDGHRGIDSFGKNVELLIRPAAYHAAAADQQRLGGLPDHVRQNFHISQIRLRHFQIVRSPLYQCAQAALACVFFSAQGSKLGSLTCDILHNINQHRAGTSAPGYGKGFPDDIRQLVHIPDDIVALGNRHGNAGDIHLLEGILSNEVFRHVAGDEHHGGAVHIGRGNSGHQVGAAGAGGGKAHANLAGGTGIAVGSMGRTLLMGRQDMPDLSFVVVKLVIDVQNCAAGVAKNGVHSLLQQAFHQNLRACHLHCMGSSLSESHIERGRKKP